MSDPRVRAGSPRPELRADALGNRWTGESEWNPRDCFSLCINHDYKATRRGAKIQADALNTPQGNRFHIELPRGSDRELPNLTTPRTPFGNQLLPEAGFDGALPLGRCTQASRLDIHAVGTANDVGGFSPAELAEVLHAHGVRALELLKIHSHHAGSGGFLEKLHEALEQRDIVVRKLEAPTGFIVEQRRQVRTVGNRHLTFMHPMQIVAAPVLMMLGVRGSTASRQVDFMLPESQALKVVTAASFKRRSEAEAVTPAAAEGGAGKLRRMFRILRE